MKKNKQNKKNKGQQKSTFKQVQNNLYLEEKKKKQEEYQEEQQEELQEDQEEEQWSGKIFTKIGKDQFVTYGDGGNANLKYPLFYSKQLPVPAKVKERLEQELEQLDKPVLDIIDPDLNPNYFFVPPPKKQQQKAQQTERYPKQEYNELNNERSKYAWFPVDVYIDEKENIKVGGEIRNLDIKKNVPLYNHIFTVFKAMIPAFKKLDIIKENQKNKLQVVVKAQKYVIAPGTSYSGK